MSFRSSQQTWFTEHPVGRYIAFLILMLGFFVFGVWRLTVILANSVDRWQLGCIGLVTIVIGFPVMIVIFPRRTSRSWTFWLPIAVFTIALVLAAPVRDSQSAFPQAGYMQVPGDVLIAGFAIAATIIRTRQKFWTSDWRPGT